MFLEKKNPAILSAYQNNMPPSQIEVLNTHLLSKWNCVVEHNQWREESVQLSHTDFWNIILFYFILFDFIFLLLYYIIIFILFFPQRSAYNHAYNLLF